MATLDALRKLFEEATSRVGDAVTEYERTPSPSAGEARELFGLPPAKGRVVAPLDTIPSAIARPSGVLAPLFDVTGTTGLRDYSPEQDAAWEQAPSGTQGDPLLFRKNWPLPADWTKVSDAALEDAYFAEENPPAVVQREFERRGNLLASAPSKVAPTRALARPPTARRQAPAPAPAAPSTPAPVAAPQPAPVAAAPAPAPRSAAINPWATADRNFAKDQIERAETPLDRERRGFESLAGLGAGQITPALRKIIDDAVLQGYSASGAGGVETLPLGFQEAAAAARAQASADALRAQTSLASERARAQAATVASPIPVASAPTAAEAPTAATGAIAPTGPQTPAGTPDSAGATDLPVPSSPGSGDDVLGRLSLGQALVRALEGSGSVIAGRDLRSGMADTLGERMRQIEALRAKRQEQAFEQQRDSAKRLEDLNAKREDRALELAREDEQSAALVEQYKSLAAQDLVPALEGLDRLPVKQAASLIKTYAGLPGTVARTDKTRAEIPLVQARTEGVRAGTTLTGAKTKTEEDTRGAKVGLFRAKADVARAQAEKLRQRAVVVKQAADTKAASDIRAAGNDAKAAEKAITRAMETAEIDKLGIAANIRDFQGLESVAPGFTRGVVPSWLGQGSISAARSVPSTSEKAAELSSALETFIAGIRKSLFGASLTGNEKASFDAIVSSGLLMPPAVLAANINRLRAGAARFAQNHFTVAQELHPEVTGRVLKASTLFGPAVGAGGIYSDVWTLPKAPATAVAGGAPAPAAGGVERVIMIDKEGKRQAVRADQVERAKAQGWRMP